MAKKTWKKDSPDGTNYSYWLVDGWVIETKRRFLPAIGYSLMPPARDFGECFPIRFDTLREAKAAAELPRQDILEMTRQAFWAYMQMLHGTARHVDEIHQRAIEEDVRRATLLKRCA